jgi:hypothetical protein
VYPLSEILSTKNTNVVSSCQKEAFKNLGFSVKLRENRVMAFDPRKHLIKVQGGRQYLPVSARLIWFRSEHPDWGIVTEIVEINHEKQYAIFRATIFNEEGRLIATSTKREDVKGFGDFIEKAETGAIGRALALCGYGTQFEPEFTEGGFGGSGMRSASPPPQRFEPRLMNNGGPPQRLDPPAAPVRRAEAPRPAPRPAPPVEDDELPPPPDLESLGLKPASAVARPAPKPAPPVERPAPPRPAPPPAASGSVQRVREPEREFVDPGGEGDDFEDPFAQEDAPPLPARPANRSAAPARKSASDRLL